LAFLGSAVFPHRAADKSRGSRGTLSSSFTPAEVTLSKAQSAGARLSHRLLSWAPVLFSTSGNEGPLAAGVACPLRSALRVWLPSRRFPPFGPLSVLFHTDGAPEIRPSKPSPPTGYAGVSAVEDPRTVCRNATPATAGRHATGRFLGFAHCESPWPPSTWLARRRLAAPLGFPLPGFYRQTTLTGIPPDLLSRASPAAAPEGRREPAPQSFDRSPPGPIRDRHMAVRGGRDNPPRVFAPVRSRALEHAAFRAMGSPLAASHITADRPTIFGRPRRSTGAARDPS
jgi:hypothetical protein